MLNVSRSGYYAWRKHGQTVNPRKQRQIERDEAIKQAFIDSKERNGARRIQVDLAELDMTPDIKTIRNSMIRQGLVPKSTQRTIGLEVGVQNAGAAMMVALAIMQQPALAVVPLMYGILMNVPAFAFMYWSQRQSEQPALQGQSQ